VTSTRPGELPTGIAILGLLVIASDTIAGLGLRLQSQHPGGRWPRNSAHTSVPVLARRGLIRVARPGRERSLDLYEPTPAGVAHFQAWMRRPAAGLPAQRDALLAKLTYVDSEGLLRQVLRELLLQEERCRREGEAAVTRYATARSLADAGMAGWRANVRRALAADEAGGWYERARRLRRLREQLEGA
jgi:DNA-binding PadR family transcriptional regulator